MNKHVKLFAFLLLFVLMTQNALGQSNVGSNIVDFKTIQNKYVERNYEEAIQYLKTNAENGDSDSQILLALSYMYGIGVPKSEQEFTYWMKMVKDNSKIYDVVDWIKQNAEKGDDVFQMMLGSLYSVGFGINQDYSQSVFWLTKSAEQGNETAQLDLVTIYYKGIGVDKDEEKAKYWYKKAKHKEILDKQSKAYGGAMVRNIVIIGLIVLIGFVVFPFLKKIFFNSKKQSFKKRELVNQPTYSNKENLASKTDNEKPTSQYLKTEMDTSTISESDSLKTNNYLINSEPQGVNVLYEYKTIGVTPLKLDYKQFNGKHIAIQYNDEIKSFVLAPNKFEYNIVFSNISDETKIKNKNDNNTPSFKSAIETVIGAIILLFILFTILWAIYGLISSLANNSNTKYTKTYSTYNEQEVIDSVCAETTDDTASSAISYNETRKTFNDSSSDYQYFPDEGFRVICDCDLIQNSTHLQMSKEAGIDNIIGSYTCALNETDPDNIVIVSIIVTKESVISSSHYDSDFYYYAENLKEQGISYNFTDFKGVRAIEYLFTQIPPYNIPTKAIFFYRNYKSYAIMIGTKNSLNYRYNQLLENFEFIN